MTRGRRIVLGVLLLVAAAAAAIAANLALLRLAEEGNDPVGKLSPKAGFTAPSTMVGQSVTAPPVATVEPGVRTATETETETEIETGDD